MSSFQFRLQRVLRWRSVELGLEEAKLTRLLDEEAKLQAVLARIQNEIIHLPDQIDGAAEVSGHDLHCIAGYAVRLAQGRDRARQRCREKRGEIEVQAEVHRQAKQRQRLLEELRAKKHGEWQIESNREDDELAHESYLARWAK